LVAGLLVGCGGGSSAPALPAAPVTSAAKAVGGTGTLTIRYPTDFRYAPASAAKRRPAFVDPTNGAFLDIYVDGRVATNLDGVTPSDSATVNTASGFQTISGLPLTSTGTNDVVVIEWDAQHANILALGETPSTSLSAGGTATVAVTLQMNVTNFLMSSADLSYQVPFGGGNFSSGATPSVPYNLFVFPLDPNNGFSPSAPAGSGGFPSIVSFNQFSYAGLASAEVKQISGNAFAYIRHDGSYNPDYLTVFMTNPAGAFLYQPSQYPGLVNMYYSGFSFAGVAISSQVYHGLWIQPF
jgi:hypothetical protein